MSRQRWSGRVGLYCQAGRDRVWCPKPMRKGRGGESGAGLSACTYQAGQVTFVDEGRVEVPIIRQP